MEAGEMTFHPRDEAERAAVVALVRSAARDAFTMGRHTNKAVAVGDIDTLAEQTVPKVPTQRRVIELKHCGVNVSFRNVDMHGQALFHVFCGDDQQVRVFGSLVKDYTKLHQHDVAEQLLALMKDPDEPAAPSPAMRALTWAELSKFAINVQRVTKAGGWNSDVSPDEVASLNAKLNELLHATPGRELPVRGYEVRKASGEVWALYTKQDGPDWKNVAESSARHNGCTVHVLYDGGLVSGPRAGEQG